MNCFFLKTTINIQHAHAPQECLHGNKGTRHALNLRLCVKRQTETKRNINSYTVAYKKSNNNDKDRMFFFFFLKEAKKFVSKTIILQFTKYLCQKIVSFTMQILFLPFFILSSRKKKLENNLHVQVAQGEKKETRNLKNLFRVSRL